MSRAPKKQLSGLTADTDEDAEFFATADDGDAGALSFRLTPKQAIAKAALERALPNNILRAAQRGEPVVVLIDTANVAWTHELAVAALKLRPKPQVVSPVKPPTRYEPAEAPTILRPTFAITSDRGWLAPALVAAADVSVRVTLTPQVVEAALKLATGRKARVEPLDIVGLDVLDVASAIRPGESAAKAVRRMKEAVQSRTIGATKDDVPLLRDLVGYGAALATIQSIADDVEQVVAGGLDAKALPSLLIFGKPGVGKTLVARSFAKTVGLPLILTSVADWFASSNGHLGDVVVAAQRAFDRAVASSPSILFVDELDALPDRSAMDARSRDWWLPVVTGVLMMIDRTRGSGVVLIGATNYRDRLDDAIRRPGRFDRHVEVTAPQTVGELSAVLRHHLRGALENENLTGAARLGVGATGAQAEDWVRQAKEMARREDRPLALADLAMAIAPRDPRCEGVRRAVAIHEAGHAVVGRTLGQTIVSVSIIESGAANGATNFVPSPSILDRKGLERQVVIGLGGRAADELLSGGPSSGAQDDLRKVTQLAAAIHASFGLGATLASRTSYSAAGDLVAFDASLRRLVEADLARLMKTAREIVQRHRSEIEALAAWLVVHRFGTGADVEALLAGSTSMSSGRPPSPCPISSSS
ncbi:AAA family ATPase [Hansschlegelia quercus]|uniref:AAA family ATPase n=1 Tax=Hansschlegelia quercus TaxID=2528245 RepID=A0A4Q9GKQ3_9HYPH|nr:AAA family ATPase [Hansschlegelia quercus]TBN53635.1 AAA family ATPase [Hansschlegelia quercus]